MCSTCTSTTINCSLNFSYGSRKLCVVCLTETLPIFTRLHRTNLCSKRDATYHDTHTHIHTHLGAHLTQFICHKLRVMFLISAAATAQACLAPPTATCHTAHHTSPLFTESNKNELSLSKSWNLIRQPTAEKRIIQFWSGRLSAGEDLRLLPNEFGWQRQMQIIASCYSRLRPLQRPVTS